MKGHLLPAKIFALYLVYSEKEFPVKWIIYYTSVMSQGETLISLLLLVIIYFLYHIAKQLSFLTGKRLKISFFKFGNSSIPKIAKPKEKEEKLTN